VIKRHLGKGSGIGSPGIVDHHGGGESLGKEGDDGGTDQFGLAEIDFQNLDLSPGATQLDSQVSQV